MRLEHGLLVEVAGKGIDGQTVTVGQHQSRNRPVLAAGGRPFVRTFVEHLSVARVIAGKDLRAELRGRQAVTSTLFLAAVTMLIFGFALGPDRDRWRPPDPASCGSPSSSAECWPSGDSTTSRRRTARSSCSASIPSAERHLPRQGGGGLGAMLALGALILPLTVILFSSTSSRPSPDSCSSSVLARSASPRSAPLYAGLTVRLRPRGSPAPPPPAGRRPAPAGRGQRHDGALAGDPFGELTAWLQLLAGYDLAMRSPAASPTAWRSRSSP